MNDIPRLWSAVMSPALAPGTVMVCDKGWLGDIEIRTHCVYREPERGCFLISFIRKYYSKY